MIGAVIVDEAPVIAKVEGLEGTVQVTGAIGRVRRHHIGVGIVDTLPRIFEIAHLMPKGSKPQQIHQRAPGHATERVSSHDARKQNLHSRIRTSTRISTPPSDPLTELLIQVLFTCRMIAALPRVVSRKGAADRGVVVISTMTTQASRANPDQRRGGAH